jgi:hypothetical protein
MKKQRPLRPLMRSAVLLLAAFVLPVQAIAQETPLCLYGIYSDNGTSIRDRSVSIGALVGSGASVSIGNNSIIIGSIYSGADVDLIDWAIVDGSITAAGDIDVNFGASVIGDTSPGTAVPAVEMPTYDVAFGNQNINLWPDGELELAPGDYRDVHVFSRSVLTLETGVYNLRQLILESDVAALVVDVSNGPIEINVEDTLKIGDRVNVVIIGEPNPALVDIYTNATNQVTIGNNTYFFGTITAPSANVVAYSRSFIEGALYGNQVTLETDATIVSPGCGVE